jgi:putative SOS response-associated peptidase YedK
MCGRFLLEPRAPQAISAFFGLADEAAAEAWQPRWNLAPTQDAPVVRRAAGGGTADVRSLARLRWGLIPAWTKDAAIGSRLINARAETVREKPSFRAAFRARRCIVPATGWYEWQAVGARKQPWLLRCAGAEFTPFAALWESWRDPAGGPTLETFAILTTAAAPALADIHDRMPVVLDQAECPRWLDTPADRADELEDLMHAPAAAAWERIPVSTRVNNPRHDAPDCAAPISP